MLRLLPWHQPAPLALSLFCNHQPRLSKPPPPLLLLLLLVPPVFLCRPTLLAPMRLHLLRLLPLLLLLLLLALRTHLLPVVLLMPPSCPCYLPPPFRNSLPPFLVFFSALPCLPLLVALLLPPPPLLCCSHRSNFPPLLHLLPLRVPPLLRLLLATLPPKPLLLCCAPLCLCTASLLLAMLLLLRLVPLLIGPPPLLPRLLPAAPALLQLLLAKRQLLPLELCLENLRAAPQLLHLSLLLAMLVLYELLLTLLPRMPVFRCCPPLHHHLLQLPGVFSLALLVVSPPQSLIALPSRAVSLVPLLLCFLSHALFFCRLHSLLFQLLILPPHF
mmetsp:Transcript_34850/g.110748  ORF Transcript_34850/g.110748 Transcript_34850/m.110748 type:complete len:330 (-) Transcript_34850:65-1054(-)